jgi:pimeloyl-ACP methyl ester carboxylesterase
VTAAAVCVALALAGCGGGTSADPGATSTPTSSSAPATSFAVPTSTTPTPSDDGLGRFREQKLAWRGCGEGLECAELTVPLDYAKPDGRTITLALAREPAADREQRAGSIVVNPGGPGGSGVDYVSGRGSPVSPGVRERFDIVGFDPRGVQRSAALKCLSAQEADRFYSFDGSPDSEAEATAGYLLGERFAQLCAQADASILPFLGTRDAARDLDILRAALGEKTLNYLGKSYGTLLGARYAEQFPGQVGRFVLDGGIDPSLDADGYARGQATGFERALDSFIADCASRRGCPLGRDRARAEDRLNTYLERLDTRPQQVGDRQLTQALAILGVVASLYSTSSWGTLRTALGQGFNGNGAGMLALADFYSDRRPDGTYATNSLDAFYGISCLDRDDPKGVDATQRLADDLTENVSRTFGAFLAWGNTPCQSWTIDPTSTPGRIAAEGAGPILVVGTTRDPATPYEWSEALAEQLSSGTLLTYDGDGHTAYRSGSECIDRVVDRLLLSGTAPEGDVRC